MDKFKTEIRSLKNKHISFKRIVGNSIILYFHGNPGDANIKSIWIDPGWRYEFKGNYIIGSGDFPCEKEPHQTEKEFRSFFDILCAKTDRLVNARILNISFDTTTNDLHIKLNNDQIIKSFVTSSTDEIWIYRDAKVGFRWCGYCDRIEKVKERKLVIKTKVRKTEALL